MAQLSTLQIVIDRIARPIFEPIVKFVTSDLEVNPMDDVSHPETKKHFSERSQTKPSGEE